LAITEQIIPNYGIPISDNIAQITHAVNKTAANTDRLEATMNNYRQETIAFLVTTLSLMYDLSDNETYTLMYMVQQQLPYMNTADPIHMRSQIVVWIYDIKDKRGPLLGN
jgi:hypothetical protein